VSASNYPPGVSGNEPQITGVSPVDPDAPFETLGDPEEVFTGGVGFMGRGWGVYDLRADPECPASCHPTQQEAKRVAEILNGGER
jgi:hypothetical protein